MMDYKKLLEVWRPVPEYEDLYEVSSHGRVRSLDRAVLGKDGRTETHHGKVLKPQKTRNGYLQVSLCRGAMRVHRTIHTLVAEAFYGKRPTGCDVMHIDGDRENNYLSNLRYDSRSENLRSTYNYGGKQANGKLSLEDVDDIRHRIEHGDSCPSIARDYNVHPSTIYHIRDGKAFAWYKGGERDAGNTCTAEPVSV